MVQYCKGTNLNGDNVVFNQHEKSFNTQQLICSETQTAMNSQLLLQNSQTIASASEGTQHALYRHGWYTTTNNNNNNSCNNNNNNNKHNDNTTAATTTTATTATATATNNSNNNNNSSSSTSSNNSNKNKNNNNNNNNNNNTTATKHIPTLAWNYRSKLGELEVTGHLPRRHGWEGDIRCDRCRYCSCSTTRSLRYRSVTKCRHDLLIIHTYFKKTFHNKNQMLGAFPPLFVTCNQFCNLFKNKTGTRQCTRAVCTRAVWSTFLYISVHLCIVIRFILDEV